MASFSKAIHSAAIRAFDVLLSLIGILLLLPVYALIALLIRIGSVGTVFFIQDRVGMNRKNFRLIKYRTMEMNAESSGHLVTAADDVRVSKIGRILRRTKLDELPELWNVLIGDMSLVGPRPEVPRYVQMYKFGWEEVFSIRPGITDLATLQFLNEEIVLSFADDKEQSYLDIIVPIKIELAMKYVRHKSVWLYFSILFRTLWSLTFGKLFDHSGKTLAHATTRKIVEQQNDDE